MTKKFAKILLSPLLGKRFFQRFFILLYRFALKGMNFGGGVDPKESGEDYVIKYVLEELSSEKLVIFDIGANRGSYTKLWLKNLEYVKREALLHIFEPSEELFKNLNKEFEGNDKIKLNKRALSDKTGEAILYSDAPGSGLASLAKRDLSWTKTEMNVQENIITQTLDAYCREQGVLKINFLKLDVEGFEFAVLRGAKEMLENRAIEFIQFEFGGTDIDTRIFFKDFFNLLSGQFKLYRILKNGLHPVTAYSEFNEIFITTNYLAVRKEI